MSKNEQIAIKVDNVSKDFKLPHLGANSVKNLLTGFHKKSVSRNTTETQSALKDINFEVKHGEFFGIVGRNGSGKSTLLKILAGIYQPTQGTVVTRGKLVPFIELGVGFNSELTGRENVYLNGALLGFSEKEIDALYEDIVSFAELERFMDQKLKNYSSGMQVRLAFSMATRSEADILLVDEVLAVGDADFQRKCFDYFKQLKKNKKTVVFVTHDMGAVREYCDRGILIEESEVVLSGTADEIATHYTHMFNDGAKESAQKNNTKRRGNGIAKIQKADVTPRKIIDKSDELVITALVKSFSDVDNLVTGFSIKNGTGTNILGTNTKLKMTKTGHWKKDEIKKFEWKIPNVFSDGEYTIDLAVTLEDTITITDWWESALTFRSFEDNITPYVINPDIKVQIINK